MAESQVKNAPIGSLPMGAFLVIIEGEKGVFPLGHTTRMRNSGHAAAQ